MKHSSRFTRRLLAVLMVLSLLPAALVATPAAAAQNTQPAAPAAPAPTRYAQYPAAPAREAQATTTTATSRGTQATIQSHGRASQLSWVATGNPSEVRFKITQSFRRSYFTGSAPDYYPQVGDTIQDFTLYYGDGGSVYATLTVTYTDTVNDWFIAEGTFTNVMATGGPWTAYYESCCRLSSGSGHMNNPDGNYRAETFVDLTKTSSSPVSSISPIVDCPKNAVCNFSVPATDADGQSLSYRFATGAEAASGVTFTQPAGASVNASTGLYSWDTTGAALAASGHTYYSTQVMVENRTAGGDLAATVAVDFFIRLSDSASTNVAPAFDAPTPADGTVINVPVGGTVSFTTAAHDDDTADTVTLGMLGKPSAATYATVAGNPAAGTFTFSPAAATDDAILTLLAQDQNGLGAVQRSITINAQANQAPAFYSPTPANGATIVGYVGQTLAIDVLASDPDEGGSYVAADTVTLGISGAPAGSSFTSNTTGNSASSGFSWTPSAAGTLTVTFTATDNHGLAATPTTVNLDIRTASGKVLILDSTVSGGASSYEAQAAQALGFSVEVVDDTGWAAKTTADFQSYRALILGDPTCSSYPSALDAVASTTGVWGPAVDGNVILIGTDNVYHYSSGGSVLLEKGIAFATTQIARATSGDKTGAYITLSCYYHGSSGDLSSVPALNAFGSFEVTGVGCHNDVQIVASHAAFSGLTEAHLSGWSCSVHEAFTQWPAAFATLAIATSMSDNVINGAPYILVRGDAVTVTGGITLEPRTSASSLVGGTHTVTATIVDSGGVSGRAVNFSIVSGPHAGTTGTATTDGNGQASWTYTGTTAGTDSIEASFVDSASRGLTSNRVPKTWTAPVSCASISLVAANPAAPAVVGFTTVYNLVVNAICPVDGVEAHVDFDPSKLEVVSIAPPSGFNQTLLNTFNNTTGRISMSFGQTVAPFPTGTIPAGAITFRALAPTAPGSTPLAFDRSGGPHGSGNPAYGVPYTDVTYGGASILGASTDGSVVIYLPPTVAGSIEFEVPARGAAGDARWAVSTVRLTVYEAGTSSVLASRVVTTDAYGTFVSATPGGTDPSTAGGLVLHELGAGGLAYDLEVKHPQTLSRKASSVVLGPGSNPAIAFGVLPTGDVTDNNHVNVLDFSRLRVAFDPEGDDGVYAAAADLNVDELVDIQDVSLLTTNFGDFGPLNTSVVVASERQAAARQAAAQRAVRLSLEAGSGAKALGSTFTVAVKVDATGAPVDGAQVSLAFDPRVLQVVSIAAGGSLDAVLESRYDNASGRVSYAAASLGNSAPTGAFTLATITFKAIGATDSRGTALRFVEEGKRQLKTTVMGAVRSTSAQTTGVVVSNPQASPTPPTRQPAPAPAPPVRTP